MDEEHQNDPQRQMTDHQLQERLIIYIDLLGTSASIMSPDMTKMGNLITLLTRISMLSQPFDLKATVTASGSEFQVRAEITTFSDHIVISYPAKVLYRMSQDLGIGLMLVEKVVSGLAEHAIKSGFLLRGGATVGPLHHQRGVVVGEALVEAYKLESTVAIYPRIVVSRKLYSKVTSNSPLLTVDDDGITYFDYFLPMLGRSGAPGTVANQFILETLSLIDQNVAAFEQAEKWNEMAKWVWFKSKFSKALSTLQAPLQAN